jgi:hypothetical protein
MAMYYFYSTPPNSSDSYIFQKKFHSMAKNCFHLSNQIYHLNRHSSPNNRDIVQAIHFSMEAIRLYLAHPNPIYIKIDLLASQSKVVKYLHLTLQHPKSSDPKISPIKVHSKVTRHFGLIPPNTSKKNSGCRRKNASVSRLVNSPITRLTIRVRFSITAGRCDEPGTNAPSFVFRHCRSPRFSGATPRIPAPIAGEPGEICRPIRLRRQGLIGLAGP